MQDISAAVHYVFVDLQVRNLHHASDVITERINSSTLADAGKAPPTGNAPPARHSAPSPATLY